MRIFMVVCATLLIACAGLGYWILMAPRSLDCASTEIRDITLPIAKRSEAMIDDLARDFIRDNPFPKTEVAKPADRIAAEDRIAQLKQAVDEAERALGRPPGGVIVHGGGYSSPPVRPPSKGRAQLTAELFKAQHEYNLTYGRADAAAQQALDRANAENREAVRQKLLQEVKYTLDAVRTSDKNLAGALTCAAVLIGEAKKYSSIRMITYKVEPGADGSPYVTVEGLKGF